MEKNLHSAAKITLIRCPNGWLARDESNGNPSFVFESTQSLAAALVRLIGESHWKAEAADGPPSLDDELSELDRVRDSR